ncbi:MAG: TetR/AcrR family transcriptional regulator [Hyphomonadaceae bacterium]|nr:TetR/AcrR family transcriptional regulator [Hyphomonadaceae bacterium]
MSTAKNSRTRVRRPLEEAREHILAAAERLLIEEGPLSLKLVDVAAASGVVNATVLHHFGSIGGLHSALMERMIGQLVAKVLALGSYANDAPVQASAGVEALFEVFETRGAARLAAWLQLTGEWRRMTVVGDAVRRVVEQRTSRGGMSTDDANDLVLVSVVMAMGAGLFGRAFSEQVGKPPDHARKLVEQMLREHVTATVRPSDVNAA